MTGYTLEVELPGLPPLNAAANMTWKQKRRPRKMWLKIVAVCIPRVRRPKGGPLKHAHVTIIRCSSAPPDGDNLAHAAKWILDSLVELEILAEDKAPCIGKTKLTWRKTNPNKGFTVLEIAQCEAHEVDTSDWMGL